MSQKPATRVAVLGASSFVARNFLESADSDRLRRSSYSREQAAAVPLTELLQADLILYCLAAGVQSGLVSSAAELLQVNALAPMQLAVQLEQGGFHGTLVTFGSYFELGNRTEREPASELEVLRASGRVGDYGASKRVLTRFMHEFHRRAGFRCIHLLLPNVYGRGENQDRLIPYLLDRCRQGLPISLTSGAQIRQYLHVRDLVTLLVSLCGQERPPAGLFCVAPPEVLRISELADLCLEVFQGAAPQVDTSRQRSDSEMPYLALDADLAQRDLGFRATIDLREGIVDYLEGRVKC